MQAQPTTRGLAIEDLGRRYWLAGRDAAEGAGVSVSRGLAILRAAVAHRQTSLAELHALLCGHRFGPPIGTSIERQWAAIEDALYLGSLALSDVGPVEREVVPPHIPEPAPEPEPIPEPIVDPPPLDPPPTPSPELDRPTLYIPTPSLLHCDRGSVLIVPAPWTQARHPLAGVVHPLVSLLDHPERALFIVGHASALGSSGSNQTLSERRCEALRALIEDDGDRWAAIAKDDSSLRDIVAYLDYLGRRRGWACGCEAPLDEVEPEPSEVSEACVRAFQLDYNARFEPDPALKVDGVCGPKTRAAIYAVLRDEFVRWLDKLGTSPDELPLERVHYRAYGDTLAEREADPGDEQAAHGRRVDLILYDPGEAEDAPESFELAELYDDPDIRRLPFVLPDEPDDWTTGPFTIVTDLTEHERFEPETYRLRADDDSFSCEHVVPDDAFIEAGEHVLRYERLPTDKRYSLSVVSGETGYESTIFTNMSYGQLHGARPTMDD